MKRQLRRLERILINLGLQEDTYTYDVKAQREVQAALFLLQVKQELRPGERLEELDLSIQPGYFFKWYGGPFSSRLDKAHKQLVDHLRHGERSSESGLAPPFQDSLLVRYAHDIGEDVKAPPVSDRTADFDTKDRRDRSLWMRTLASTAYGLASGWKIDDIERTVGKNLGPEWSDYVEPAMQRLEEFGLLKESQASNSRAPALAN